PLIENSEYNSPGADYFINKNLNHLLQIDPEIDTIILGCTHYPILENKIKSLLPDKITVVSQGKIVAESLKNYLQRHPEIEMRCTKKGTFQYYTTESVEKFSMMASIFLKENIQAQHIEIG
ncbi:MAG TPA: glutamate racemase, partial [Paludibacteraceae bacterium]|nr:glutamate racemase [Paludibacteraceae bacterium]